MKEQLIKQGIRLFREKGFDNTTIDEICEACHVTKGSFYYHLRAKEDILTNYYTGMDKSSVGEVFGRIAIEPSYIQKAWLMVEFYTKASLELGPDLLSNLISSCLKSKFVLYPVKIEAIKDYNPQYYEVMHAVLEAGQEKGEVRSDFSADELLEALTAYFVGLLVYWCTTDGQIDIQEMMYNQYLMIVRK